MCANAAGQKAVSLSESTQLRGYYSRPLPISGVFPYPTTNQHASRAKDVGRGRCMFGLGKRETPQDQSDGGPRVSAKLCSATYNGKYPTVGLYDCKSRKSWVC